VYPLAQAGTEIYTAALAGALARAGVEVKVAIPSYAMGKAAVAASDQLGDPVEVVSMSPGGRWGNKVRALTLRKSLWKSEIRRIIRSFRPDLVHVQHPVGFGLSLLRLLEREKLPIVVTLPDYWLLCEGVLRRCRGDRWQCASACLPGGEVTGLRKLVRFCRVCRRQRRIARFIRRYRPTMAAISEATRQTFIRAGFPAELIVTRPWGIDEAPFRSGRNGKPGDRLRIGYLGSVRRHKGCHVLLDAFIRLDRPAELHFYGSGDEEYTASLRAAARGQTVYFHGRFDHASVPDILAAVDLVVIPSVWEETYCLVFQEAMAAQTPAIATAVGGLADRVVDGVNGFLVPPGDAPALSAKLAWVQDNYSELSHSLDYRRCQVTLEQDCRGWMDIYASTMRRVRAGAR
jgi:glycosyltransferase involved in cell wall biosynthesis